MKKTFKVVMLPTEKESKLILIDDGINEEGLHYNNYTTKKFNSEGYNFTILPQHLYIISDDVIKKGDWIYITGALGMKQIAKVVEIKNKEITYKTFIGNNWGSWENNNSYQCKKIVATTDKSLNGKSDSGLQMCLCGTWQMDNKGYPKCKGNCHTLDIHESFIQAYIKAYNEGKPITEVDLEMEIVGACTTKGAIIDIKTRPDNTVIVHQSKMYSRDEVIDIIYKSSYILSHGDSTKEDADKWIQDNL